MLLGISILSNSTVYSQQPTAEDYKVYREFLKLMDTTNLSDDQMYQKLAHKFNLSPSEIKNRYDKVFTYTFTIDSGEVIKKAKTLLKQQNIDIVDVMYIPLNFYLSVRYVEKFAAWDEKEIYQKAMKHASNIANIILSNMPDVDKVRLDAQYPTMNNNIERIGIFDYERTN